MESGSSPTPTSNQIGLALFMGSTALLMLGLQPILLGELVDKHVITMEGVGIVAMGEIVALGVGVALGDAVLPLARYRLIAAMAALAVGTLDAATLQVTGDAAFSALRGAAGLAEGVLVWIATSLIVRTDKPDRLAAIFMVVQTISQTGMALALATCVVPQGGWRGGFLVLAAATSVCALLALGLPPGLRPLTPPTTEKTFSWSTTTLLPLATAFLQMAAIGSLWAYLEPLGVRVGFGPEGAQAMVSEVLCLQVAGGMSAIWLVRRFDIAPTLGTGALVLAAVAGGIWLLPAGATLKFSLFCAVFGFSWLFLMPFHFGLALRVDAKGRIAMLVPAAQLLGSAFGPLTASLVVSGDDATPVPLISLGFAACTVALVLFGRKRWTTTHGSCDAPRVAT
ncbi:hypothetical protein [Telmatospirillum sp.]|uniref:hypothetical protein n=1 Tax=Telmatospirillum sp. TaxID=2079197 RepID=UPI00283F57BD|nr:hypothetical protein [Telmatospirillum sp.]MDR3438754.1 hypothetical protein [Telmatospirillum sp.]